jgi:peptidyl-dipeptidase Dcp
MTMTTLSPDGQALLDRWPGPYGGLPPLDGVTPAAIEAAMRAAMEIKRAEVAAVSAKAAHPT